jgi:hypothetical protein
MTSVGTRVSGASSRGFIIRKIDRNNSAENSTGSSLPPDFKRQSRLCTFLWGVDKFLTRWVAPLRYGNESGVTNGVISTGIEFKKALYERLFLCDK